MIATYAIEGSSPEGPVTGTMILNARTRTRMITTTTRQAGTITFTQRKVAELLDEAASARGGAGVRPRIAKLQVV